MSYKFTYPATHHSSYNGKIVRLSGYYQENNKHKRHVIFYSRILMVDFLHTIFFYLIRAPEIK